MDKLAINGGKPTSKRYIQIANPVFTERTVHDIREVLQSGNVCQGIRTSQFEEEFRKRVGAKYAYAVSSGTAALHIAFMSILKTGDEVIVPAFTFIATASTVALAGGRPVFADIDGETLTIDPNDVNRKITSRTKAIVPVHLFGNASDMKTLSEIAEDHSLSLVNDAAQAHGTTVEGKDVGCFDDINCYSFYPTKTITTGEGGMVTTNSEELYNKGRLIRNHGQENRYLHVLLGLNYRMTEIAAVIGLNQLRMFDEFLSKRKRNARVLKEGLSQISGLKMQLPGEGVDHSYSYFTVIMDLSKFSCTRNEFIASLRSENVGCMTYYPISLTKQPALERFANKGSCPVAEELTRRVFSIPVHPNLNEEDLTTILNAIEKVSSNYFI